MKRITVLTLIVLMLILTVPVSAARELPVIGDRISIYNDGSLEFAANTPFHIMHGWQINFKDTQAIGVWDFNLAIDGVPVEGGLRYIQPGHGDEIGTVRRIYNFPQGMPEGTYIFNGYWITPCQYGPDPSNCEEPNAPVISKTTTVEITFLP